MHLFDSYTQNEEIETHPFNLADANCNYFDVHDKLPEKCFHTHFQYKVFHLNILGLPSKFDQLNMLLPQLSYAHVEVDYILLCETFLNDDVVHLFKLPSMVKDMCYGFIWRLNSLSANFGFCYISTKRQLLMSYSASFYGVCVWNVKGKYVDELYITWRKGIRKMFNLPVCTHCNVSRVKFRIEWCVLCKVA